MTYIPGLILTQILNYPGKQEEKKDIPENRPSVSAGLKLASYGATESAAQQGILGVSSISGLSLLDVDPSIVIPVATGELMNLSQTHTDIRLTITVASNPNVQSVRIYRLTANGWEVAAEIPLPGGGTTSWLLPGGVNLDAYVKVEQFRVVTIDNNQNESGFSDEVWAVLPIANSGNPAFTLAYHVSEDNGFTPNSVKVIPFDYGNVNQHNYEIRKKLSSSSNWDDILATISGSPVWYGTQPPQHPPLTFGDHYDIQIEDQTTHKITGIYYNFSVPNFKPYPATINTVNSHYQGSNLYVDVSSRINNPPDQNVVDNPTQEHQKTNLVTMAFTLEAAQAYGYGTGNFNVEGLWASQSQIASDTKYNQGAGQVDISTLVYGSLGASRKVIILQRAVDNVSSGIVSEIKYSSELYIPPLNNPPYKPVDIEGNLINNTVETRVKSGPDQGMDDPEDEWAKVLWILVPDWLYVQYNGDKERLWDDIIIYNMWRDFVAIRGKDDDPGDEFRVNQWGPFSGPMIFETDELKAKFAGKDTHLLSTVYDTGSLRSEVIKRAGVISIPPDIGENHPPNLPADLQGELTQAPGTIGVKGKFTVPDPEDPDGDEWTRAKGLILLAETVNRELQQGYTLGDIIQRHADDAVWGDWVQDPNGNIFTAGQPAELEVVNAEVVNKYAGKDVYFLMVVSDGQTTAVQKSNNIISIPSVPEIQKNLPPGPDKLYGTVLGGDTIKLWWPEVNWDSNLNGQIDNEDQKVDGYKILVGWNGESGVEWAVADFKANPITTQSLEKIIFLNDLKAHYGEHDKWYFKVSSYKGSNPDPELLFDADGKPIDVVYWIKVWSPRKDIDLGQKTTEVHVFPNPFRYSRGDRTITFDNLPAGAKKIEVYNLSGKKVAELEVTGTYKEWRIPENLIPKESIAIYRYLIGEQHKSDYKFVVEP